MKILLRFRDTGNQDTIAEHLAIIKKQGYAWWGWWKKESEPDRFEVIDLIQRNTKNVKFYFFDRSTERYYSSVVSEIVQGKRRINTPVKKYTPKYYNEEKLYCWFKIKRIIKMSQEQFLNELKSLPVQDFTFFTEEDLFNKSNSVESKVERIKLQSDVVLHLSDIHFGDDFGFPIVSKPNNRALIDILVDHVKNDLKKPIGLLIISGDISSRGNSDVLHSAGLDFLERICSELKIPKEAVVITPGNHDLPLKEASFTDYKHEKMFTLFLKEFYGTEKALQGVDNFEFPSGLKVDLLRINSVKLRKKEESNYGYVDWFLYKNILGSSNLNGDLKIAVVHHHLVSTPIEESLDPNYPYAGLSVTIDSGRVIEGLQKAGFHIVLNGHQHMPGITRISRGTINDKNKIVLEEDGNLTILSAGSAGVKTERFGEQFKYNTFSLYHVSKTSMEVEVKYYNPSLEPRLYYRSTIEFSHQ